MIRAALAAILCATASVARAYEPGDVEFAEGILSRLALERGAFIACGDDPQIKQQLATSWDRELQAVIPLLTQRGFPEAYVAGLSSRFGMSAVTPSFPDGKARATYCAALGDWQRRWELFYVQSPEAELRKMLDQ